jgi:pyruvate/2-oxoglutarate dehydrogenase complex dihydrolipoamide dehydrogenase (E3) component
MTDVIVIGAGPAGVIASLRAADLGARTILVTRAEFGGMAANDGPVPVRTLAHAARLMRDARQLGQYGIVVNKPTLDYARLLDRVREVVDDARAHSSFREQIDSLGVTVYERAGAARFIDENSIETESGRRLRSEKFIICTGGVSRRLPVPGCELASTHSDAWSLTSVPPSMLVIGAGASGIQVASIFNAFGSDIQLFQAGPRILPGEDEDISAAVALALRKLNIVVNENFGSIEAFEKTPTGVRMIFSKNGKRYSAEATLAVVVVGWMAETEALSLATAGVEADSRGFVKVDDFLRTSASHIFAAGDITGRVMLVPQAIQDGFVAATNAVRGLTTTIGDAVIPVGSFTNPEYAQVGLTEAKAREKHDIVVTLVPFDRTTRTIIDGRKTGFCKLITDRRTHRILGCHVVGERAVEITQVAAIAIAAKMPVDELARIPLSFPTYAGTLARVAASAARSLNLEVAWQAHQAEGV